MPDLPWLLAIALVAVYIGDSVHFLCLGEAVAMTRGGRIRGISFGFALELGGRRPYVPNPLTPFWPELRFEWDTSGRPVQKPEQVASEMARRLEALRRIGWLSGIAGALIAMVAPIAVLLGQDLLFIVAALSCFAATAVNCVLLAIAREDLGITRWQVVSLSLISLVCLPCAGNLARAAALQHRWRVSASELPLLAPADRRGDVRRDLRPILLQARQVSPEQSVEYAAIGEQLRMLEGSSDERE
jgi:hypothetical protein